MFVTKSLFVLVGLIVVLGVDYCNASATEEQMWAAGKLMRDVCQPRFPKITNEIADKIKDGVFPEDKDGKCYITCVLEMMQTIKKGKFLLEASLKQVELLLPDELKDEYRTGLTNCKSAGVGTKNNCEVGYLVMKCLFGQIPRFVFP